MTLANHLRLAARGLSATQPWWECQGQTHSGGGASPAAAGVWDPLRDPGTPVLTPPLSTSRIQTRGWAGHIHVLGDRMTPRLVGGIQEPLLRAPHLGGQALGSPGEPTASSTNGSRSESGGPKGDV